MSDPFRPRDGEPAQIKTIRQQLEVIDSKIALIDKKKSVDLIRIAPPSSGCLPWLLVPPLWCGIWYSLEDPFRYVPVLIWFVSGFLAVGLTRVPSLIRSRLYTRRLRDNERSLRRLAESKGLAPYLGIVEVAGSSSTGMDPKKQRDLLIMQWVTLEEEINEFHAAQRIPEVRKVFYEDGAPIPGEFDMDLVLSRIFKQPEERERWTREHREKSWDAMVHELAKVVESRLPSLRNRNRGGTLARLGSPDGDDDSHRDDEP